ncbi:tripartite tricarboxylate transporter substrate binding protein [Rubrivivax sp. JA1024]|nr:tripartite tricarboxylate transporter substrate binding protein [Rubrivivax sp. JA1024]
MRENLDGVVVPALKRRSLLLAALAVPGTRPARAARGSALRLIVPFVAGGGVDAAARLLASALQPVTGTPVVVENHPGASGTIGGRLVLSAPPDGRTLLFSAATHIFTRQVLARPPYDPQTDFAAVTRFGLAPLMLVMAPRRPEAGLPELLDAVRREPGTWSAGIPSFGSPGHLATLDLARRAALRLNLVPYKGTQPALMDVAGGHVDLLLDSMVALLPLARAGRVRALALSAAARSRLLPSLPTFGEAGLPGFEHHSWYGVWAPAGTPAGRVAELDAAVAAATAALARAGALEALGIEPAPLSPDGFRRFVAAQVAVGAELLRASGFRAE